MKKYLKHKQHKCEKLMNLTSQLLCGTQFEDHLLCRFRSCIYNFPASVLLWNIELFNTKITLFLTPTPTFYSHYPAVIKNIINVSISVWAPNRTVWAYNFYSQLYFSCWEFIAVCDVYSFVYKGFWALFENCELFKCHAAQKTTTTQNLHKAICLYSGYWLVGIDR